MSAPDWTELSRPAPDHVLVGEHVVRKGSRVVLRPHAGGDVLTRGLDGRRATIESVDADLDDTVMLSVVLEDDPARALGKGRSLGHRFFFAPDEIEPLSDGECAGMPARVLVAGIGNVFLGDDGFGVYVARALAARTLPAGVDAVEFGIRGMDLAYALGDGYDAAVLVDPAARGAPPGTLSVIDPEIDGLEGVGIDSHGMDPVRVLALARRLGPLPRRTLIVTCEPGVMPDPDSDDICAELSAPVSGAVDGAATLVCSLVGELHQALGKATL
jgi:hydrogenase maturation protease